MGSYHQAAEFYDLLYAAEKDYAAEAEAVAGMIRESNPAARRILDVGCGTGIHAQLLSGLGFTVDGVDLEPAFVDIAGGRCPEGKFTVQDMTTLDLVDRYDAIVCLFSAIGYVRTVQALRQTVARFSAHLDPGGVLIVDPWFEPGQLTDRWVSILTGGREGLVVCRVSRTLLEGSISTLECEYLIGRPTGIERRTERHELGLFSQHEMEESFRAAGLTVDRHPKILRTRGIYVGRRESIARGAA